jgi:hypothetical protein
VVAGADVRRVEATSEEVVFNPGAGPLVGNEGRQLDLGVYAEDLVSVGRLSATAALRFDRWGQSGERRRPGTATTALADHQENALSPRLSLRYPVASWLSLTSAAYRSFRAPTLNELYRLFRLGNVLTLANEAMRAERMGGVEAGALARRPDGRLAVRASVFWNEVHDAVTNVTLSSTAALITRQRKNVALIRARGIEADAEVRLGAAFTAAASWLFVDSVVVSADEPALAGLKVAQVPSHQAASASATRIRRCGWACRRASRDASSTTTSTSSRWAEPPPSTSSPRGRSGATRSCTPLPRTSSTRATTSAALPCALSARRDCSAPASASTRPVVPDLDCGRRVPHRTLRTDRTSIGAVLAFLRAGHGFAR